MATQERQPNIKGSHVVVSPVAGEVSLGDPRLSKGVHLAFDASQGALGDEVRRGAEGMQPDVARVQEIVDHKVARTQDWIARRAPGHHAIFHRQPFDVQGYNPRVQERLGEMMAEVIVNVYGDKYPLPNKEGPFNTYGLQQGHLLAYFGMVAPRDIDPDVVQANPARLLDPRLQIAATSAIVLEGNGFAELGRNARRLELADQDGSFEGAALSHQRFLDWAQNRGGLLEMIHTLRTDTRGAVAHDGAPSSGAVQRLILGQLGMKVTRLAPLYNVRSLEPIISASRFRDQAHIERHNLNRRLFVPRGADIEGLRLLWKHQLGYEPRFEFVDPETVEGYGFALPTANGPHVYGTLNVLDEEKMNVLPEDVADRVASIQDAVAMLDQASNVTVAKIAVEDPRAAATQQILVEAGFVYCGIEPAQVTAHVNRRRNGRGDLVTYKAPAYIHMTKMGRKVRSGDEQLIEAYIPDADSDRPLHSPELRQALRKIDTDIRNSIRR